MKFAKKIILSIMTVVFLTSSAMLSFAQQESMAYATASSSGEIQTRAIMSKIVTQKIYWFKNATAKYEVGTVDLKVTYNYNSITRSGSVESVEVVQYNVNEDFSAYQSTTTKDSILIYVKNLSPATISDQRAHGLNKFVFSVTSQGDISTISYLYFQNSGG